VTGADVGERRDGREGRDLFAAIDIGTNSIHLLVARALGTEGFQTITTDKAVVRLGSGSGDMKHLARDAIDRGVAALARFGRIASTSGATVRAVATSAVREAANRDEFLRRARDEAGIEVEVVSGAEEARLIHLGVVQSVAVEGRRVLVIDIGGGSTEVVVGEGPHVLDARSLKLGAIRLTERWFRDEPLTKSQVKACRAQLRNHLAPAVREVAAYGFDLAVGSSGTIINVAEMALARRGGRTARSATNATITRQEVEEVVAALVGAPTARARARLPALDPRRADIIVGGALLLEQLFAELGIEEMTVSSSALREGVLLDTLQRERDAALHQLGDIRRRGVRRLMALNEADEQRHAEHTARLALELFDATAGWHRLGEPAREFLEAAALLANVGLVISHAGHHLHSSYVIRHAEQLVGFTEREVELIAQVARYHRKSEPKPSHPDFVALDPDDQQLVRTLAGLLRVAIALDRTHARVVRHVRARGGDDGLTLELDVTGDAELERYTADERKGLLERALGVPVRLATPAPTAR